MHNEVLPDVAIAAAVAVRSRPQTVAAFVSCHHVVGLHLNFVVIEISIIQKPRHKRDVNDHSLNHKTITISDVIMVSIGIIIVIIPDQVRERAQTISAPRRSGSKQN